MRDIRFFGDVDWLENGGVFIGKAYSEEEEKAYPAVNYSVIEWPSIMSRNP